MAWASPAGLESWFLRKALITGPDGARREGLSPVRTGDNYEWYWHGHPDNVEVKGKFLEANGRDRLGFTFSLGCPVHITLLTECDETIVELVESSLPAEEEAILKYYVEDSKGWIFYLANLKSILEGGLDLRNKKMRLVNVINS
jgi:hypothetical protein